MSFAHTRITLPLRDWAELRILPEHAILSGILARLRTLIELQIFTELVISIAILTRLRILAELAILSGILKEPPF